jgi:hypothetical protein
MRDGDWVVRVDADEFHHLLPPIFVRECMRSCETAAYHQYYDFCLTASEVRGWSVGLEGLADRARPIGERRRWFTISSYSEPRLCRYRSSMRWAPGCSFPFNAGFVAKARLPIRHYPHRDPVQMERRCRLRAAMMADAVNSVDWVRPDLHHWSEGDWRSFVVPNSLPGLMHWDPGTPLPQVNDPGHVSHWPKRTLQRIAHGALLPVLDRCRPTWPAGIQPRPLPGELAKRLTVALGDGASAQPRSVSSDG